MRVTDEDTGKDIFLDRTPEFETDIAALASSACTHSSVEVRRRKFAGDSVHYFRQCTHCGDSVGSALKRSSEFESAPAWDDQLGQRYVRAREIKRKAVIQKHVRIQRGRTEGFWKRYNEYLASESWLKIRERVFQRSNGRCEGCGIKNATQVHHLNYTHVFEEFLFELVAVCDDCHRRLHADEAETNDHKNEWSDGFPCDACRWSSEEKNRRWCVKFDVLAVSALAKSGECGPMHEGLEPLK